MFPNGEKIQKRYWEIMISGDRSKSQSPNYLNIFHSPTFLNIIWKIFLTIKIARKILLWTYNGACILSDPWKQSEISLNGKPVFKPLQAEDNNPKKSKNLDFLTLIKIYWLPIFDGNDFSTFFLKLNSNIQTWFSE